MCGILPKSNFSKIILSMFLSLVLIYELPSIIVNYNNPYHSFGYGILSLFIYVMCSFVIYKALVVINLRLSIICSILGFVFSVMLVLGKSLLLTLNLPYTKILFKSICISPIVISCLILLIHNLPNINNIILNNPIQRKLEKYLDNVSIKYYFCVFFVILLCYIPVLLATFPGIFSYDAISQIFMYYRTEKFTSQLPPIHTLMLGLCFDLGKLLYPANPDNAGTFIYCSLQMTIVAAMLAYLCYYLAVKKLPVIVQIFTILFCALLPVNQIFAVCTIKEVIFSCLLILAVIFTIEAINNSEKFFHSKFLLFRFCLTIILAILFRNNEIYAFVLCIPCFLLVFRKYLLKISILCISILLIYAIISGPLYSLLNIGKGDIREALSIPIQQVSRAVCYDYDKFTDEEKQAVSELMGDYQGIVSSYSHNSADNIKTKFNTAKFKTDPCKYLHTYCSILVKCPKAYLDAFFVNNLAFYFPNYTYFKHHDGPYIFYDNITLNIVQVSRNSKLVNLDNYLRSICLNDSYQNIPVFSIFFSQGFYCWFMLFTIAVCIYRKNYKFLLPISLIFTLWITFLFGPTALTRYSYPLFLAFPIFLSANLGYFNFNQRRSVDTSLI